MDNASFHPKQVLDEFCIEDGHFFFPLPPYSPDLNPIEKAWAVLKKGVIELLRKMDSITDALTRYLKTK